MKTDEEVRLALDDAGQECSGFRICLGVVMLITTQFGMKQLKHNWISLIACKLV